MGLDHLRTIGQILRFTESCDESLRARSPQGFEELEDGPGVRQCMRETGKGRLAERLRDSSDIAPPAAPEGGALGLNMLFGVAEAGSAVINLSTKP